MSDMLLLKGAKGPDVRALQKLLTKRGYPCAECGIFETETYNAVRAFQSQNLDPRGQPLKIDGKVGPLTWWSLNHPKPLIETPAAIDYGKLPPKSAGGSSLGRRALEAAISELLKGAGEVGGNNCGPSVRKYLKPAGLPEGNSWCAAFVSWCYLQAAESDAGSMPFAYGASARGLLREFKDNGWTYAPGSGYEPLPGDLVVWWRVRADGWQGHVGLVHQCKDGILYTVEGNRGPKVQGFSYVYSRMDKLLGYGHVPA